MPAFSQCPPNIGFEDGNFDHWQCYSGRIDSNGNVNVSPAIPMDERHTLKKNIFPQEMDPYGAFPVNCPNGSGYSVKLGNDESGAQADRVSYTFTIPAAQNSYSVIYNYAVVFQNPGHLPYQQPRFTAKVFDVTSGKYIQCSSFDFAASSSLPGFKQVTGTDVFYKPWTPVTIKLDGYAGKTVRLEFTANDCTKGGHFGYAYLDINEDCSQPIKGNTYCIGSSFITLAAPFGFREYHWYDSAFSQLLGSDNTLRLRPAPAVGTKYALEVIPYPGSGCTDTLYTTIAYSSQPFIFRLADSTGSCAPVLPDLTSPVIKQGSTPGLNYMYFKDSTLHEFVSAPSHIDESGVYYVQANNSAGCYDIKPIKVIISEQANVNITDPPPVYYPGKVDITDPSLLTGNIQGLTISYWKDATASVPLTDPEAINIVGTYFIKVTNVFGCSKVNAVHVRITPPPPPNVFSPNDDGVNDVWNIKGLEVYPECTVDVYTRYGQPVFHSAGYSRPWDGSINGKKLPTGTYYYVINLSPLVKRMSGSITIIR